MLDASPLLELAREVVRLLLDGYVGCLLLLGRRVAVPPQSLRDDLVIPLAANFFTLTYNAVEWFPAWSQRSLCPVGWQGPLAITGLCLSVLGLAIALWAAVYLGRSFSILIEVKKVVLDGAYRWVRHPIYSGYLCLMIGLALAHFSLAYFVLVPIHAFLLLYRARLEEVRLCEYSAEYREYRKRTGFVFPKVRLG